MTLRHALFLLPLIGLLLPTQSLPAQSGEGDLWLMKGHDTRRTGQSSNRGPVSIDPNRSWDVLIPAVDVLNVGASVDNGGVFVGSWGIQRNPEGSDDRSTWNKFDGALFGYGLDGRPLWGDGRADLDLVHRCYLYDDREKDGNDIFWCGLFNDLHVSFYNGTVEGQGAIDTARGVIYVGRGDGKLYAVDRNSGEIRWRYRTFNPMLEDDPDGGGEVVTSPLYSPDGTIYFGTWGEGNYETNAVYAVNPDGTLRWRYPADQATLSHRLFASPALSPDNRTIYFSTFVAVDSLAVPGLLFAFDRLDEDLESHLKWSLALSMEGNPVITNTIAVGSDGVIYVGGSVLLDGVNVPVLLAVEDMGDRGELRWATPYRVIEDGADFVLGVALRERAGETVRLYATTANNGAALANWKEQGAIYAVAPESGEILGSYDPSDELPEAIGGMNSPAIDRDGRIYVGVRGHYRGPFAPEAAPGYYIGLQYDDQSNEFTLLWAHQTDSHYVEWTHPSIGPDGGIYAGSAENKAQDSVFSTPFPPNYTPEGTSARLYGLKGPVSSVRDNSTLLLSPPSPNPFTDRTVLLLDPAEQLNRPITITDILGRTVRTLTATSGTVVWNGNNNAGKEAPPGIYIITIKGEHHLLTKQ